MEIIIMEALIPLFYDKIGRLQEKTSLGMNLDLLSLKSKKKKK
jgi:hypothetical protein